MSNRKTRLKPLITGFLLFALTMVAPVTSPACTSFALDADSGPVVGANFDWTVSDGLIVVNKKGFKKTAMSDPEKKLNPVSWTSRYGSITFNMYGIDWPWAGMNEAGLVITSMALEETRYPAPDERPSLHLGQWVQYQLDNFHTVADVISSVEKIRIRPRVRGHGMHYLVCDPTGDCAVVEFMDGRLLSYSQSTLPVAALANDPYARSLDNLENFIGFGGRRKIPQDNTSYCRFARTADMLKRHESGNAGATIRYALKILERARYKNHSKTETQWSMVFDVATRSIVFNTHLNPTLRRIEMKTLNYACPEMPETLDIHTPFTSITKDDLWKYNQEMNRRRFHSVISVNPMKRKIDQKRLERISRYPETFICDDEM